MFSRARLPLGTALVCFALSACGGADDSTQTLRRELATVENERDELRRALASARRQLIWLRSAEFLGEVEPAPDLVERVVEIVASSSLPEPGSSPYPNCVRTSLVRVVDSRPADTDAPDRGDEIVLSTLALRGNRAIGPAMEPGSRIAVRLADWSTMPEQVTSIQRSDEIERLDLPVFAGIDPRLLAIEGVVPFERRDPPADTPASPAAAIAVEIARLRSRLQPHGAYEDWYLEVEPVRTEVKQLLRASERPLATEDERYIAADYGICDKPPSDDQWPAPQVRMLTSMRDQLAARGIDLIVVPFPRKELVNAALFVTDPPADGIVDPWRDKMLLSLLEAGIEIVDVLPTFVAERDHGSPLFLPGTEVHPGDRGIRIAARLVAERLSRYGFPRTLDSVCTQPVRYRPDRDRDGFPERYYEDDLLTASQVVDSQGRLLPRNDDGSPLLIVGDSFAIVPRYYGVRRANFCAHLGKELGFTPRAIASQGAAAQMLVRMRELGPELLEGRRACVFVLHAGFLFINDDSTEKGQTDWQVVELERRG